MELLQQGAVRIELFQEGAEQWGYLLKAPHRDLLTCMEMAKVADLMVFMASARSLCEETDSYYIDSFGNQYLSVFRSLGLPSTVMFIRFDGLSPTTLLLQLQFLWLFKEQRLKVPDWRTQQSYLLAQKV
ncbi:hypothetical protein RJT34_01682 [Clitoria ternatea]|uniref:Uncharacterized protein n=1 Tax=Clitoria ternatea TaxID=43366 RepID=A0AAN9KHB8_CLITE